jgi:catechol 2,3-dioxygenase-like lactoylglutathione lyase family enzyme
MAKPHPASTMGARATRDWILRTPDWEAARAFYGSVLGLPIRSQSATLVGFEAGDFCLYVEKGAAHGPVCEFLVDSVAAAKVALLAAGCTVLEELARDGACDAACDGAQTGAGAPRCYLRDPFGLVFNIGERAASS